MGENCHTAGGKVRRQPHIQRWKDYKRRWISEEMVFELRQDDDRFNLSKGDRLLCINYPYDSKVTVLRRLSDGFDPECNQYMQSVQFIGFARDLEGVE